MAAHLTVVEFYSENEKCRCGYCKKLNSIIRHGMWAHQMSVEDYQNLIDRGWRRSGRYCYKPTMNETCCPMYTIRCSALEFKPSKSQKKLLKQMTKFLASDDRKKQPAHCSSSSKQETSVEILPEVPEKFKLQIQASGSQIDVESTSDNSSFCRKKTKLSEESCMEVKESIKSVPVEKKSSEKDGANCIKKAKLIRRERKKKKLMSQGMTEEEADALMKSNRLNKSQPKKLEEFLNPPVVKNPAHRLEVRTVTGSELYSHLDVEYKVYRRYQMVVHQDPSERCSMRQFTRFLVDTPLQIKLVRTSSEEFDETLEKSWSLYSKYQMAIHKDPPEECSLRSYVEFLVTSPLKYKKGSGSPPRGYGSFHQQYWLDGKLIAVGVIDILPKCVSSVYFFYDPDYSDLTLGTYGSLREVAFVKSLQSYVPQLRYYYMGFYIHTCPKMRYKANLLPSDLLCPETYTWFPVKECLQKLDQLDKTAYCRFNPDLDAKDLDSEVDIFKVTVLYSGQIVPFSKYLSLIEEVDKEKEVDTVSEFASLVGKECASRMVLIRNS